MVINIGRLAKGFEKLGFKFLSNWDELKAMNKGLLLPKSREKILEIFVSFRNGLRGIQRLARKGDGRQGRSFSRPIGDFSAILSSRQASHHD